MLYCFLPTVLPGTSDEHIAVVESLKGYNPDGAILVTTPQVTYQQQLESGHMVLYCTQYCAEHTNGTVGQPQGMFHIITCNAEDQV